MPVTHSPRLALAMLLALAGIAVHAQVAAWTSIGPAPVNAAQPLSGSVTSLAPDTSDATGNTLLLGTAGGGVWRTTNLTATTPTFSALTSSIAAFGDGTAIPSLAIGALAVQPGGTGVYLAGTGNRTHYGEGLLRSINSGQTWSVINGTVIGLGGTQSFAGEGFSAFAWSGATPQTVVASVASSGDGAGTGAVTLGASARGLYYSTDGGASWQMSTIEDIAGDGSVQIVQSGETNFSSYDGNSATAVVWNPLRAMFFAAVAGHGVYSSPDGSVFTRLATQPEPLTVCPTDPGFAASANCPFVAAALTVQPVSGDMFLWFADSAGADQGLYLDRCAAQNGTCSTTPSFASQLEPGYGTTLQQSAGMALLAVPNGASTTLLAGASATYACLLSADAGACSFAPCGQNTAGQVQSFAISPASAPLTATSAGAWAGSAGAPCSAFRNLNAGIGSIASLNSIAGSAAFPAATLAGGGTLGSLGTAATPALPWTQLTPGDGGAVALDVASGSAYANTQPDIAITRCTEGTACGPGSFTPVIGAAQVNGDAALEHPPLLLDPANSLLLLTATCRVWRGAASGAGWPGRNAVSPVLDGSSAAGCTTDTLVTSLAAGGPVGQTESGAAVSQVLYAGMAGLEYAPSLAAQSAAGAVFVNANAATGTAWTDIATSPVTNAGTSNAVFNQDGYDISAVFADPHDSTGGTVYATIRGFGVPLVYLSTNFGASWLNITSNLPDWPANALAVDPNDANTVYIALDGGVYYTRDIAQCAQQNCWQPYGAGLPAAQVTALATLGGTAGVLRAATLGLGAWQAPLATGATTTNTTATIAPSSLTFTAQQESTSSAPQTVTVTNTGTLALRITRLVISPNFTETDTCAGATVAPGANCAAQVVFTPATTGSISGALIFYGNVSGGQLGPVTLGGTGLTPPSIQLSPSGTLAFGDVTLGASSRPQDVLISNTGQSSAALNSFFTSGDFAIAQNACGATLAPQTGCAVTIVFTPTARGVRTGTFTVTDSAGTQTLALTGTGQSPANVTLSPTTLSFPATPIGTTSTAMTVTATNSGDVPALLTSVIATGDFQASSACGTSLNGGASCTIAVVFAPTQAGARMGTLSVTTPFQTLTVSLGGTGVGTPKLTLSPASLNFGSANIGQTVGPLTMTLTNTGTSAVTIVSISTTTATPGTQDYAATSNCATLAPQATCTISVTFTPSVAGADPGTLTVQANIADASITAALNGSGNLLAFPSVNGTPTAKVPSGQMATYAVWLNDDGATGAVTFSCSGLPPGASCSLPQGITLPGSGQLSITVKVATGSAKRGTYAWRLAAVNGGSTTQQAMSLTIE